MQQTICREHDGTDPAGADAEAVVPLQVAARPKR